MARSSLDHAAAEQMIAAQMPLTEKIARADHVVWNNGTARDPARAGGDAGRAMARIDDGRRSYQQRPTSRAESRSERGARPNCPTSLDLNELQTLAPAELEELCQRYDVRVHPGRTRHHQILDLVRCALGQRRARHDEGFFDTWPILSACCAVRR